METFVLTFFSSFLVWPDIKVNRWYLRKWLIQILLYFHKLLDKKNYNWKSQYKSINVWINRSECLLWQQTNGWSPDDKCIYFCNINKFTLKINLQLKNYNKKMILDEFVTFFQFSSNRCLFVLMKLQNSGCNLYVVVLGYHIQEERRFHFYIYKLYLIFIGFFVGYLVI